jgi:restriction system protein
MSVPEYQTFFKPLLEFAADGKEHSLTEARTFLSTTLNLSKEDLSELLPSGIQTRFHNRAAWAKSYFIQAGVLVATKRSCFKITQRGLDLLKQGHPRIDNKVLSQYPEFLELHNSSRQDKTIANNSVIDTPSAETPEESLQKAYQSIRTELANEILIKVKENSPRFFEEIVVDLMVAMGYGGSRADAGKSIGQTGDEGIDGIIKEDRLGLDVIYLQAKRWEGSVGRPEIQKFVGALHGKRAKKGVFITTGKFTGDAIDYVENIDPKVILIDGRTLCEYMIDFGIGTTTAQTYQIKRIDSDYFIEE